MQQRTSFFTVMCQCLQDSIRIGLLVSILLSCIVMVLGNLVQARINHEIENTETQNIQHPAEMQSVTK